MYKSKELLRKLMENNQIIAELVTKSSLDGNEKRRLQNNLRNSMKTYCLVDYNCRKYELCESELDKRRSPEDFENSKNFRELLESLSVQKEDETKHEMYLLLEEKIKRIEDEVEAGMEISESAPNTKCPITKQTMTNPMTNKLCGHIYDKAGINGLLKQKRAIRCPVPGCVKAPKFTYSDLEPNVALRKYISQQGIEQS